MSRIITVLVLAAVCIGALGYFRGWFQVSTDNTPGQQNVTVTVDKDKIQADKDAAKEKAHDLADKH